MLDAVGYGSLDELTAAALPGRDRRRRASCTCREPLTEDEALAELRRLAAATRSLTSMIGLGYYDTHTPAVIRRNVLENPAWYTAYTPYQPEISQGRLEALLNFQTMVDDLTGLPVAGASMLDEATAAAEAMTLARRAARQGQRVPGRRRLPAADPRRAGHQGRAARHRRWSPRTVTPELIAAQPDGELFGVLLQYPGASGEIRDLRPGDRGGARARRAAAVAADLLALTLLTPPGELGADIAVGTTQRFGVPMGFGGPHAGYICVRDGLKRQLPGRLVGVSVDADGQPAYRLALQTREQHIRREKATSNICTAQVLLAVIAAMYAVYHGPDGLTAIARRRARQGGGARRAALTGHGYETAVAAFFDTVRRALPGAGGAGRGRGPGPPASTCTWPARTPSRWPATRRPPTSSCARWRPARWPGQRGRAAAADVAEALPTGWPRTSAFLTHPVFSSHRSETAMLRYLRRLADRDIALDRSMIPLGSCTMKLNAAAEMEAITWPEFAGLHPFAPAEQAAGLPGADRRPGAALTEITGYDAVRCSPTPGRRASWPGCWRSAPTTGRGASRSGPSA